MSSTKPTPYYDEESEEAFDEQFKPIGTLVLMGVFTVLLILLWLSVYAILISRGATA